MHLSSNRSQVMTIKMCVGLSLYKLHSEERMSMLLSHCIFYSVMKTGTKMDRLASVRA